MPAFYPPVCGILKNMSCAHGTRAHIIDYSRWQPSHPNRPDMNRKNMLTTEFISPFSCAHNGVIGQAQFIDSCFALYYMQPLYFSAFQLINNKKTSAEHILSHRCFYRRDCLRGKPAKYHTRLLCNLLPLPRPGSLGPDQFVLLYQCKMSILHL